MKFKNDDNMQRVNMPPIITTTNCLHFNENRDNYLSNEPYYFEELSCEEANNLLKSVKMVKIFLSYQNFDFLAY